MKIVSNGNSFSRRRPMFVADSEDEEKINLSQTNSHLIAFCFDDIKILSKALKFNGLLITVSGQDISFVHRGVNLTNGIWCKKCNSLSSTKLIPTLEVHTARTYTQL